MWVWLLVYILLDSPPTCLSFWVECSNKNGYNGGEWKTPNIVLVSVGMHKAHFSHLGMLFRILHMYINFLHYKLCHDRFWFMRSDPLFFLFFSQKLWQAGFLEGITNIVPGIACVLQTFCNELSIQTSTRMDIWNNLHIFVFAALGGVNIKELLDDAADEVGGKLLLDFSDTMGDRIQVFLE